VVDRLGKGDGHADGWTRRPGQLRPPEPVCQHRHAAGAIQEESGLDQAQNQGRADTLAADLPALVVVVAEDYAKVSQAQLPSNNKTRRFFSIASRLPLDLQMVLCRLVLGSPLGFLTGSEVAMALQVLLETQLRGTEVGRRRRRNEQTSETFLSLFTILSTAHLRVLQTLRDPEKIMITITIMMIPT